MKMKSMKLEGSGRSSKVPLKLKSFQFTWKKLLQLKSFRRGSKAPIGVEKLLFGLER